MSTRLYSPSWHRVANLVPNLRKHTQIHRHHYRGVLWYVLQDHLSSRVHRFTPAAYYFIGLMDGTRSVQQIWDFAIAELGDDAPTQDEAIRLLSQLHSADVLQCNVPPDASELFTRYQKQNKSKLLSRMMNPLSLRIPIFDPERFLNHFMPLLRALPGWLIFAVWGTIVVAALVQAGIHWPQLSENVSDRVLTPNNLFIIWLIFPVIKACHELGHAFAVKKWGGEVHEIGIMFLVLMPIPYVDASAASTFRDTKKRVAVGAAGMIVEVFIAALAMFVWMYVDTGLIHVIAYNTMLIAGVSTILFNANPLLRFDGYYILSDLIEIPNLASRANNYLGYLIQRYLFGVRNIDKSDASWGEKIWFVFFSITSFCYRMFVVSIIVLFISAKFFVIGVLLAMWSLTMMLIVPTFKSVSKIFTSPQIRPKRKRAILTTSSVVTMIIGGLLMVPIHSWTRTEGVVWVEGDAVVRAGTDCFIDKIIASPGEFVTQETPLFECRNVELITQVKAIQAGLAELQAMYDQQIEEERVKAEITKEEIKNLRAELERTEEEINSLVIKSHVSGRFVVPNATDIIGKFVRKGESIGYTLNPANVTVKAVVDQDDIDLVRLHTRSVEIRRADDFDNVLKTKVSRQVPAATDQLPSAALTTEGGGKVAIDPSSKESIKSFEKVFLVDLELPVQSDHYYVGSRVYVKFNHEWQPLADQWFRSLRQLFLGHFDV